MTSYSVRVLSSLREIDAAHWDALANRSADPFDPFLTHGFLSALEDAGCVGGRTGWMPRHLAIEGENGLDAAMPLYAKAHSLGEYVFDHGWAEAYERAGGRYYPKLQCAVPFTPVTGRRLLVREDGRQDDLKRALLAGAMEVAGRMRASSVHITFPTESEWSELGAIGLLQRTDQQFMWENQGYRTFDDFLATLTSRKRKAIRRERAAAVEAGLKIERVTGGELTEAHWDAFFRFYLDTGSRKWGSPYLNREFFSLIGERLAGHVLLIYCTRNGRPVAGAMNMIGGQALYGRYWGAIEHHPFLHFEACYYQAIDYAIEHGLARVEAGAQGEHKLARGYLPKPTYSLHWIRDPAFRDAVARYLTEERRAVASHIEDLTGHGPFKEEGAHGL